MTLLTLERLKELLDYDPVTGLFTWRVSRGRTAKAGQRAGTPNADEYIHIKIDGRAYKAHRLGWFYTHGAWPDAELDHKNRKRAGNHLENLREATRAQNCFNKRGRAKSGIKGVFWHKHTSKWVATITTGGKQQHIGLYTSKLAAEIARGQAAAIFHGAFARG